MDVHIRGLSKQFMKHPGYIFDNHWGKCLPFCKIYVDLFNIENVVSRGRVRVQWLYR